MGFNRVHELGALFIAAMLIAGDIYLVAAGIAIPNELAVATGAAVGYVFRGAVENTLASIQGGE